jgi:hypothetical protein
VAHGNWWWVGMAESQILTWLASQVVAVNALGLLLTSSLPPSRTLFVTAVLSLSPPALPGHPALPSAIHLPSAGCTLPSLVGVWRRGESPPASDRAACFPHQAAQSLEML